MERDVVLSLKVESEKRGHVKMNFNTENRSGFLLCQRKMAKPLIDIVKKRRKKLFACDWKKVGHRVGSRRSLVLRVRAGLLLGYKKAKIREIFEDYRGRWTKKHFSSAEEENAYLKAQVEDLKKLNPNLHGEGGWISKPGTNPFEK